MTDLAALGGLLQEHVGSRGPEVRTVVTRRDVERFLVATGDPRPVGEVAPALFLSSMIETGAGPPLGALRPDGTGVGREGWLPLTGAQLMGGGQDLTFHAPVRVGAEVTGTPELESVTVKARLVLLVITTTFGTADEPLLTCRETLIAR